MSKNFRRSKKEAIKFFEDNYIMISSLEASSENGCTERCKSMLIESKNATEIKEKCEYCDISYKSRNNIGFNFKSAKYCPMCGRRLSKPKEGN